MYEKRRLFSVRLSEDNIILLNKWAYKNGYNTAQVIRLAIRDFIDNTVNKGIVPEINDLINPGCIVTNNERKEGNDE